MIEFLTENWQLLVAIGVGLIEVIIVVLFKKNPKLVVTGLLYKLCLLVKEAENKYHYGIDKMDYVLKEAKLLLGDDYNEYQVRTLVEWILTLPEKKEDPDEK